MSDNRFTWVNGRMMPKDQAAISPFDHGFLYGDGCFEGIRIYNHRIFKFDEHIDRLYDSAKVMLIDIGSRISRADLETAIFESIHANEIYDRGYIRLVATRGAGDLGINPRKCTEPPTVVIIVDTLSIYPQEDYDKGIRVIICSTRKLSRNGYKARVKSLNYLNNIYGIIEANRVGAKEGIMLTDEGYVAEATVDNVFILRKGVLKTPPCVVGALDGITRQTVIELARQHDMDVREEMMTPYDLYTADEMFLTGTGAELIPVTMVDDVTIGHGRPGAKTQEILGWFREYANANGRDIPSKETLQNGTMVSATAHRT